MANANRRASIVNQLRRVQAGSISAQGALGLKSSDAPAFSKHGTYLLQIGQAEPALACGELATALAPDAASGWLVRGAAAARLGREAQALLCYGAAARLDPKNTRVWVDLAEIQLSALDYASAAKDLKRALETDPTAKSPAGKRAQVLIAQVYYGDEH
jgi:tetratricopeptide (TPR) repeat protein